MAPRQAQQSPALGPFHFQVPMTENAAPAAFHVTPCRVAGCDRAASVWVHALCTKHYQRLRKTGTTASSRDLWSTLEERFWMKVDHRGPDECWPWKAGLNSSGYGHFTRMRNGDIGVSAHGFAWRSTYHGPVHPERAIFRHLCDARYPLRSREYRKCVNPAHVYPGTYSENAADCVALGRQARGETHGSRTHPESVNRFGNAKLTSGQIPEIRARLARGETCAGIAKLFGVGYVAISNVKRRATWWHVTDAAAQHNDAGYPS